MSFILDNFGRTLQKRKESATMILISENYKTGGSKMSGQRYTVNAMGEQCPIPVVKTKKVLDSIQGDAEIEVLVDNETAVQNLTRMGKNTGAEVFSEKKSDKEFHVFIRVKDRQPVTQRPKKYPAFRMQKEISWSQWIQRQWEEEMMNWAKF